MTFEDNFYKNYVFPDPPLAGDEFFEQMADVIARRYEREGKHELARFFREEEN